MKHIINIFGCALLAGAAFVACQEKEVAGPAPVSDISVNPGYLRAEVEFAVPADAKTARVFFNSGKFADFDVNAAEATQKFLVEDLDEGDQTLRVITTNEAGVKSDPKGFQTHIYGPKYQSSLSNRILIDQAVLGANSLEVYLGDSGLDEAELRFVYFNTKGEKDSVVVAPSITTVTIDDIDFSKVYYYYTVCVPVENCIDEFTTPIVDAQKGAKKIFNKMLWTTDNAANLIDDSIETYWQASSATLPVSVVIDMTADKVFNKIAINQAISGEGSVAQRITVEGSSDGSSWTPVLEGKKLALNAYCQIYDVPETEARYVKLTVLEAAGEGPVKMAELDLINDMRASGDNGYPLPALFNANGALAEETDLCAAVPGRFYLATGWTHTQPNCPTRIDGGFGFWAAAAWGCPDANNAQVYQTLYFLPGDYCFHIQLAQSTNENYVEAYATICKGEGLDDITAVADKTSATLVAASPRMKQYQEYKVDFTITEAGNYSIGYVYTLRSMDMWTDSGAIPWMDLYFTSQELIVKDVM
ncbi:MAG: discoidin domain-containing protein [Bacteroidales bacterium]|nr:discoidin domain-containing protein [Bacteroidales bacterium]